MTDPTEKNDPLLLDHEADGIRELDNNLPRWWVWLFFLTIIFALTYMSYYHVFHAGNLQAAEYQAEARIGDQLKSQALNAFETTIGTLTPSHEEAIKARGHQIFLANCAPCHRADGGGLVGPNLCDDYWIHGSNFVDNINIILNGVPAKGMLTWRGVLKPSEVYAVASYIYTLRGTHPVNPKPPENQQQPDKPNIYE